MILATSPHSKALAQLYPLEMDAEQNAVAIELDRCMGYMDAVHNESFPDQATTSLPRWEALYELDGTGSLTERRQALLAAINADSGIAEHHYIALAASMGYHVQIVHPPRLFRAGVSRSGFPVYGKDEQYTWGVRIAFAEAACAPLVKAFEDNIIPFTLIRWIFGITGNPLLTENGDQLTTEDGRIIILETL